MTRPDAEPDDAEPHDPEPDDPRPDDAGPSEGGSALELDCRGLPCPAPVIRLARAAAQVDVGDLIAVAADDVAAATDIAAWCRMRGQEYVGQATAPDEVPVYLVRRVV